MRHKRLRKLMVLVSSGAMLFLSCPSGLGKFLAPVVQPVLGQVFSEIAGEFTDRLLNRTDAP